METLSKEAKAELWAILSRELGSDAVSNLDLDAFGLRLLRITALLIKEGVKNPAVSVSRG